MLKVHLRLITLDDLTNKESIRRLRDWRKKNKFAYPGNYKITTQSIKDWLFEYVLSDMNRFLCWVVVEGEIIGHIGCKNIKKNSVEIDNVSRGVEKYSGAMGSALQILVETYSDRKVWLNVLPNNLHAINFYKRNGFKEKGIKNNFLIMVYE